ncbi:shikimate dehydrogenase [Haloglycomyces albus]|uniref:shikimate dehydrogenase n=1 Tax=Haloglycomyces albus TaxID=526067 RepID=UPI00046D1BC6|nr:shikimate dehydrogenase [Haloglycomyces albus]
MRAAVLGSPVSHSLSPTIHNAGYQASGLHDWLYTRHECDREALAPFLEGIDDTWAGLSLTMPLKEVALDLADEVSATAAALGAANTFVFTSGKVLADNTDAVGLIDAFHEAGVSAADGFSILGAGGTARAALGAAAELNATSVNVFARRRTAIRELEPVAAALGLHLRYREWETLPEAADSEIVVSTVPKGVVDDYEIPWSTFNTVFDVVYDPRPTPLLRRAARNGATTIDGLALLLHQAVHQWTRFTGRETAPVAAMRAALDTAVEQRA